MPLPAEYAAAVWAEEIEPGLSAGVIMQAMQAVLAGSRDGLPARPVIYRAPDGSERVIADDVFDDEYFDPLYFLANYFGELEGAQRRFGGRLKPNVLPWEGRYNRPRDETAPSVPAPVHGAHALDSDRGAVEHAPRTSRLVPGVAPHRGDAKARQTALPPPRPASREDEEIMMLFS